MKGRALLVVVAAAVLTAPATAQSFPTSDATLRRIWEVDEFLDRDLVLAEVNPQMPRTHGDSFLHVSKIHGLIPVDTPLLEHVSAPPGEVERAITAMKRRPTA